MKESSKLLYGTPLARTLGIATRKRVKTLEKAGIIPHLAVILIGDDKPSFQYVEQKRKIAAKLGIGCTKFHLPASCTQKQAQNTIEKAQKIPGISGVILQLPIPKHLDQTDLLNHINPKFDVDCLTATNLGTLMQNNPSFIPPTPAAVLHILTSAHIEIKGKYITLVGSGLLVGKPLAALLSTQGATISLLNSKTPDISFFTKKSDIVITGVGKRNLINTNHLKKNAIVIDAGSSFYKNKIVGDVDMDSVIKKVSLVTPTPGGVGPLTVQKLLENTVLAAERLYLI